MLNIGIVSEIYNTYKEVISNSIADKQGISVFCLEKSTVKKCDIIITRDYGLRAGFNLKYDVHLFELEQKYEKETVDGIGNSQEKYNCNYLGYILPWKGDYSLEWWLYELSALSLLLEPEANSVAELAKMLIEKKEHPQLQNKKIWYKTLTKYSNIEREKAIKKDIIKIIRPPIYDPEASSVNKKLFDKISKLKEFLTNIIENLPHGSKIRNKLTRLRNQLTGDYYSHCNLLVTGIFSSGKTTLINQLFLDGIAPRLPVDSAANTAIPLEIFVDPEIKKPILKIRPLNRCTHDLMVILPEDPESICLNHIDEYNNCRAYADELAVRNNNTHIYYLPFGDLGDVCKRINNFSHSDFEGDYKWEIVVYIKKDEISNRKRTEKTKKFNNTDKFMNYLEKFKDKTELNELNFKAFKDNGKNSIIYRIELRVKGSGGEIEIDLNSLTKSDERKKIEDSLISWLKPTGQYALPNNIENLSWMFQARIFDTPGLKSPRPEHDHLTYQQIKRCKPGDIIMIVIRTRGGIKGIEGSGMSFLKDFINLYYDRQKLVVVINYYAKEEFSITDDREKLKEDIRKKIKNFSKNLRSSVPINADVFVVDFLNTEVEERQRFNREIAQMADHFVTRTSMHFKDILYEWTDEKFDELKQEFKNEKNRQKKGSYAKNIIKILKKTRYRKAIFKKLKQDLIQQEIKPLKEMKKILEMFFYSEIGSGIFNDFIEIAKKLEPLFKEYNDDSSTFWLIINRTENKHTLRHTIEHWLGKYFIRKNKLDGLEIDDWFLERTDKKMNPYSNTVSRSIVGATEDPVKRLKKIKKQLHKKNKVIKKRKLFKKIQKRIFHSGPIQDWDNYLEKQCSTLERDIDIIRTIINRWVDDLAKYIYNDKLNDFKQMVNETKIKKPPKDQIKTSEIRNKFQEFQNDMVHIVEEARKNVTGKT